jgi:hypothetical protein
MTRFPGSEVWQDAFDDVHYAKQIGVEHPTDIQIVQALEDTV